MSYKMGDECHNWVLTIAEIYAKMTEVLQKENIMEALNVVYEALMANFLLYVGLTMALVAFVKELFALEGNAVRVASFLVGILISGIIYAAYLFPVAGQYIEGSFFILAVGLFASGFFDLGVNIRNGG